MALNLDYITDFAHLASPEIFERGKLYFYNNMIKKAEIDIRQRKAHFLIMGSQPEPYAVEIKDFTSPAISATCTCPYDKGICKHQVAALLYLKENFNQLAQEYNKRYYPQLPEKETNKFLHKFLDEFKNFYQDNFSHGEEIIRHEQVKIDWINPLLQTAQLTVQDHKVEIREFFRPGIHMVCTCMKDFCEHKIAAALWLGKYFTTPAYQKTRSRYLRKNNKFLMIGTIYETRTIEFNDIIPRYLPEEFHLLSLDKGFIRLKLKVRYKYQTVEFKIKNNYVLTRCSCDDDVTGLCKHQIAGIHLLNSLDPGFFSTLASDNAPELSGLFV